MRRKEKDMGLLGIIAYLVGAGALALALARFIVEGKGGDKT